MHFQVRGKVGQLSKRRRVLCWSISILLLVYGGHACSYTCPWSPSWRPRGSPSCSSRSSSQSPVWPAWACCPPAPPAWCSPSPGTWRILVTSWLIDWIWFFLRLELKLWLDDLFDWPVHYLLRILLTQPWLTRSCRLMTHGRIPAAAISMILRRMWLGSGRPLMKTPPSWLTRPWPVTS